MFKKELEDGHICAVRYVWNSYVGEINFKRGGLCPTGAKRHAFMGVHQIEQKNTYQIIGHTDINHNDFNQDVFDWYNSETKGYKCPVDIHVYDNAAT